MHEPVLLKIFRKIMNMGNKKSLQDVYVIVSAIRGPDYVFLEPIKHIFTTRLRWLVFREASIGVTRHTRYFSIAMGASLIKALKRAKEDMGYLYWALDHVITHLFDAFKALSRYIDDDEVCNEVGDILEALRAITRYVSDNDDDALKSITRFIKKYGRSCLTCKYYQPGEYKHLGTCTRFREERPSHWWCNCYEPRYEIA